MLTPSELEEATKEWFSNQPMGAATRQNGPAAMEGFKAGFFKGNEKLAESIEKLHKRYDNKHEESSKLVNGLIEENENLRKQIKKLKASIPTKSPIKDVV